MKPDQRPAVEYEKLLEQVASAAGGRKHLANISGSSGILVEAGNGSARQIERYESGEISLTVADEKGRLGYAQSPLGGGVFHPDRLVERALASARATQFDPARTLPEKLDEPPPTDLSIDDPAFLSIDEEAVTRRALEIDGAARGADVRVESVRKPTFEASRTYSLISLNGSQCVAWSETSYSAQAEVVARTSADAQTAWAHGEWRSLGEADGVLASVGREAATRATELLGGSGCPTGRFPALLDRRVVADFIEILGHSYLGEAHQKKTVMSSYRLGREVASTLLTVTDDGLYNGGPDTQPVDDEGSHRRRTPVIVDGVLANLLYDRTSASRGGVVTTGNGSGASPIFPAPSNLVVTPGKMSVEGLLGAMGSGLYVREVIGSHTTDPTSGEFSMGCSGFWVEKGGLIHPVVGVAISGKLDELFCRVVALGCDDIFTGSIRAPSMAVDFLEVASQ